MHTVYQSFDKCEIIRLKLNYETDADLYQPAGDIFGLVKMVRSLLHLSLLSDMDVDDAEE